MPVLGAAFTDHPRKAMATAQRDRFDDIPADLARVGAHRAPRPAGRGFVAFAWAALATGVLVGAGVLGLGVIEKRVADVGSSVPTATVAAPSPTIDPNIDVVLLNATTTNGLAASASSMLGKDGLEDRVDGERELDEREDDDGLLHDRLAGRRRSGPREVARHHADGAVAAVRGARSVAAHGGARRRLRRRRTDAALRPARVTAPLRPC